MNSWAFILPKISSGERPKGAGADSPLPTYTDHDTVPQ
jgi:hypothetical protein